MNGWLKQELPWCDACDKWPRPDPRKFDAYIPGVYAIRCIVTGEEYIGYSVGMRNRLMQHFTALRSRSHLCELMQDRFNKYGESSFRVRCLYTPRRAPYSSGYGHKEIVQKRERWWIRRLKPAFNAFLIGPKGKWTHSKLNTRAYRVSRGVTYNGPGGLPATATRRRRKRKGSK